MVVVIVGILIVLWVTLLVADLYWIWTTYTSTDEYTRADSGFAAWLGGLGAGLWLLVTLIAVYATQHPDNRPCVQYSTTSMYNATTKMVEPVRYCSQYGEWAKGDS